MTCPVCQETTAVGPHFPNPKARRKVVSRGHADPLKNKKFSPEDVLVIRAYCEETLSRGARIDYAELGGLLGRSYDAVKNKCVQIGYSASQGRTLMADNPRDNAYMRDFWEKLYAEEAR